MLKQNQLLFSTPESLTNSLTMRKPFIAANWKMHGNVQSIKALIEGLKQQLTAFSEARVVICPSFPYLSYVKDLIEQTNLRLGAQDCSDQQEGAFTGQVSASMLNDVGCNYVILGHSERRALCNETDTLIAKKVHSAQTEQLTPILCVGETLEAFEQNQTQHVVLKQLETVIDYVGIDALSNMIIAYEPVWAIGTGKAATPETIQQVHHFIRTTIAQKNKEIADKLLILYGGSVKIHNAKEIFMLPDVDGGLIGGASLDPNTFSGICYAVQEENT